MLFAAVLAAANVPFSKFLLAYVPVYLLAGLTFLGGSLGAGIPFVILRLGKKDKYPLLAGKDWLDVLVINILDCGANAMLFAGIYQLNGETASLLQSFEVVATALFAFTFFKEKISWRLLLGILAIVGASVLLSFNPEKNFEFNPAALLIVGATLCWGIDNNLTKRIAKKDPFEFAMMKCLLPGVILTSIGLALGERCEAAYLGYSLLDGALAYGLSVVLMTMALEKLSAAAGTTVYAANPFIGALLSLCFFPEIPSWNFYVALALLLIGEAVVALDALRTEKKEKITVP